MPTHILGFYPVVLRSNALQEFRKENQQLLPKKYVFWVSEIYKKPFPLNSFLPRNTNVFASEFDCTVIFKFGYTVIL